MIGGFLKSQHTLLNLSGSTEIGTLQTGSSIVGISINGNPYTENNDIPLNWTVALLMYQIILTFHFFN